MRKILREYQLSSLDRLRAEFANGARSEVLVAPTGAGKTVIICELIRLAAEKGSKIIFLAHRKELITQCSARLYDNDVYHGIIKSGIRPTISAPVQVASVQTLVRRDFTPPDILVIDECHHARAETYRKIIDRCRQSIVIGLTATPCRTDGKGLEGAFQGLVQVTTTKKLIEEGFLVPAKVFAPTAIDTTGLKIQAGDYSQKQLDPLVRKSSIYGDILKEWKKVAADRPTVLFAVSIAHSQELVEIFKAAGVTAEHVDGATPEDERDAILKRFAQGQTQVVSNCGILTEGWDCPSVSCLVVARPTASLSLHLQIVGRGLRTHDEKYDCIVLDHAGNHIRHGFCDDDREWSLAGIRKRASADGGAKVAAVRICPKCYLAMPTTTLACPGCGHTFPVKQRRPEQRNSELAELQGGRYREYITRLDPLTFMAKKMAVVKQKGYRPGWAKHQFHMVFGKWPDFSEEDLEIRMLELNHGRGNGNAA
jgi:superfamily II DNA or RNA helicase